MKHLFYYQDYKLYLQDAIRNASVRGFQSQLADAAKCQRAYLSRVLRTEAQLTLDQAMGVTKFLNFREQETNYFLDIVSLAKTSNHDLREVLQKRLTKTREELADLKTRYETNSLVQSQMAETYYSSWHWAATHIIVSIPSYQSVAKIAKRLNLAEIQVQNTLTRLQEMGLVQEQNGKWSLLKAGLHLSRDSIMNSVNHLNWRHKAVLDSQATTSGLHYTAVQSHSEALFDELKDLLLKYVDKSRALLGPSPEEELSCLCIDYFKV